MSDDPQETRRRLEAMAHEIMTVLSGGDSEDAAIDSGPIHFSPDLLDRLFPGTTSDADDADDPRSDSYDH